MKKQDIIFIGITVGLILVASVFAFMYKITFNEWLASFGAIVAGVALIRQTFVIKDKNERIRVLEQNNDALTKEYYKVINEDAN